MTNKVPYAALAEWNCLSEEDRQLFYSKAESVFYQNELDKTSSNINSDIHNLAMSLFLTEVKEFAAKRLNS